MPSERKAEPSWKLLLLLELRELYESPPTLAVPSTPLSVPHTSASHGWKAPRPPCLGCRHLVFRRICLTNEACPVSPGRLLLRGQAAGGQSVDSTVLASLLGVLETGRPSKSERGMTQPVAWDGSTWAVQDARRAYQAPAVLLLVTGTTCNRALY